MIVAPDLNNSAVSGEQVAMNSSEKEGHTEQSSAHHFPSIQPSLEDPARPNSNPDFSFRPLYQGVEGSSGGHLTEFRHKRVQDGPKSIEQVGEDSYQKGFEAGKAEACHRVQQELDGPIERLKTETLHYQDSFTQITKAYSDQIVQLTLAIAKSILGPDIEFDTTRQEEMRRQLRDLLNRQYQLVMKVTGDDLKTLSEIMACEDPHWYQSHAMRIISGADTLEGGRTADSAEATGERLKANFSQEFETPLMDR
jgi:hypothetical protein